MEKIISKFSSLVIGLFVFLLPFHEVVKAQIILPSAPKMELETALEGQVAIQGYSVPIGPIVPPLTDPGSIGNLNCVSTYPNHLNNQNINN